MAVDITAQTIIERSRADVARFATDPHNDPQWIGGISKVEVLTKAPFGKGTRVARAASFLGKTFDYVLEVIEYDPATLLAMRSVKGPIPMTITYEFADHGQHTDLLVRVEGDPSASINIAGPMVKTMVKRTVKQDLERLKGLLEKAD